MLQTASVIGRAVPLWLLEAIWRGPPALTSHLSGLLRLEFLYEHSGTEEAVYLFKHALTEEVAYASLLTPRRQALHAAAGRALTTLLLQQRERVEQLGNPWATGRYWLLLAHVNAFSGDRERRAAEHAQRAMEAAMQCGDHTTVGRAHCVLALHGHFRGDLRQGVQHARQAVALPDPSRLAK